VMRRLILFACLATVMACAPKSVPVPVVSAPKFPDFIAPTVPESLAATRVAANHDRGWRFLQAGALKDAEREFDVALRAEPAFYPSEAGLGYVELARRDPKAALPHFDRVLGQQSRDISALVGRGEALLALGREDDALPMFEAALAVDPSIGDLGRRVEVLRFRAQQEDLSRARQAARTGRLDEAIAAYDRAIGSSPDSAFLYRERAGVERERGLNDRALEDFRKAVALEPSDGRSLAQIGEILDGQGDVEGAIRAFNDALAAEPNEAIQAKLESLRARVELASLPEEYRAIDAAPQITRGDLAALVGVRLASLLKATRRQDAVLITDLQNTWAATWIMAVARAGVMDPFPNHAFQPRTVVRRVDLAQVVSRLLGKLVEANPRRPSPWQSARIRFSDLAAGHLAYRAASAAVASGVMTLGPNDSFLPSRPVSGQEAIEAIGRVDAMTRGSATIGTSGR
jgi:tetratricopeptide (TPR) repeat protein